MDTQTEITRACRDCQRRFVVTVGEQKFFATKGYPLPYRCMFCRRARKLAYAYAAERMTTP